MVGGEGRGLDVWWTSVRVIEVEGGNGVIVIASESVCCFVQGKLIARGASAISSSSEVLFVCDAALGWGSGRKLKSDWGVLSGCSMVSGAGTLRGRAAYLLPVSEYVA